MRLPATLQHFPRGALLIASDTVLARCFFIGGDSLEELDGVALPREKRQDSEGAFTSFDGSRVAGPASNDRDAPRLRAFAKKLATHITSLERQHQFPTIHLLMPTIVERYVLAALSRNVRKKLGKLIHHEVLKESPLSLVKRVVEALPYSG